MKNENKFSVSRFNNRNGVPSWRVSGWLCGIRIRKNFKTKEEAAAEKGALELKALQATSGLRSAITFLADAQIREAEDAFRRLDGHPRSLLFYLNYAFANYRDSFCDMSLSAAVTEYIATKQKEHEQTLLSERQLRSIKYELEMRTVCFDDDICVHVNDGIC